MSLCSTLRSGKFSVRMNYMSDYAFARISKKVKFDRVLPGYFSINWDFSRTLPDEIKKNRQAYNRLKWHSECSIDNLIILKENNFFDMKIFQKYMKDVQLSGFS